MEIYEHTSPSSSSVRFGQCYSFWRVRHDELVASAGFRFMSTRRLSTVPVYKTTLYCNAQYSYYDSKSLSAVRVL